MNATAAQKETTTNFKGDARLKNGASVAVGGALSPLDGGYRVRLELDRAPDRQEAFVRAREVLARFEDSPERQAALRVIADRLENGEPLPHEIAAVFEPHEPLAGR